MFIFFLTHGMLTLQRQNSRKWKVNSYRFPYFLENQKPAELQHANQSEMEEDSNSDRLRATLFLHLMRTLGGFTSMQ